jgi:hypothetical protein
MFLCFLEELMGFYIVSGRLWVAVGGCRGLNLLEIDGVRKSPFGNFGDRKSPFGKS